MWPPEAVAHLKLAAHSGKTVNIRFKDLSSKMQHHAVHMKRTRRKSAGDTAKP